jgi:hypothetical protein
MSYLSTVFQAIRLRRDPYLRMVLARDGVADGALIVGAVYLILAIPGFLDGVSVISLLRLVLSGLFGWIILSGLVYLIGRHGLEGYGSFPSVMAASSLAYPPLILALLFGLVLSRFQAGLVASVWLVACLWMAARVSLDLSKEKAVLAAGGGYLAWLLVSALFRF